jgi:multiple sugar transport system substrate-binding protein
MFISKLSKQKDQAFRVMSYMLSNEVQTSIVKAGRFSVLDDPEMEKIYGADLESLKGKNIAGIFKAKPRKLHPPTEFDKDIVKKRLKDAAKEVAVHKKDVNTALREAEDTINKQIEEAKASK